jgi:hypothetical protein
MSLGVPSRLLRKTQLEVNDLLLELVIAFIVNALRATVILSTIVSVTARLLEGSLRLSLFSVFLPPVFALRDRVWLVLPRFVLHFEFLKAIRECIKGHAKLLGEQKIVLFQLMVFLTLQLIDFLVDLRV